VRAALAACGGFLLGVLWMDLMFDVQALGHAAGALPEEVLAAIAGYYRRVTTEADPMGRLVGIVLGGALAGTVWQAARRQLQPAFAAAALLAVGVPLALALLRVLPNAVRLGTRADSTLVQSELARAICREHLFCLASMLVFVAIQLCAPRRDP
jgi:hypothetical protein